MTEQQSVLRCRSCSTPDKAARLIARAIERRRRFYVLPWQMAIVGRVLRMLPRPLYDVAFARAPRKPRVGE